MEVLTIRNHGGNAFKESHYNNPYSDPEKRDVFRRCFIKGYVEGVKMYANHLYNKGSIFDIVDSIRRTAEYETWAPLMSFEKIVLIALKQFAMANELEKKARSLEDELRKAENRCLEELKHSENVTRKQKEKYEAELEIKDRKIAYLENILASLTKRGYK